jgi:hypothetical protein
MRAGAELGSQDAWLFRIAHEASLDFLRHRGLVAIVSLDGDSLSNSKRQRLSPK